MKDLAYRLPHFFRQWAKQAHGFAIRRLLMAVLLVLLVINGLSLALIIGKTNHNGTRQDPNLAPGLEREIGAETTSVKGDVPPERMEVPREIPSDPRFAFLLLGYGGIEHEGAYLTDSIVAAIANPDTKTLTLLSIPRDCWAPLLFDGQTAVYNKLNTAYAFAQDKRLYPNRLPRYAGNQGAGRFAADTVSRLLGVPISNYLALDFAGFRKMIDAVGGIDVNVPNTFTARYPANDNPAIDPSWITVHFTKGVEHMNGERAIRFVRAREVIDNSNEGGDFARSRRQRLVMEAFKDRLLEPGGLLRLPQIMGIASQHVDTDYAITDIAQFGQFVLSWKEARIYQTALTVGNYLTVGTGPGGAYIAIPDAPGASWAQIRAFVRRLWQDPAVGLAMADTRITVVNRTGEAGAASRLSAVLMKLGYRVGTPGTGQTAATSRLVDRTAGQGELLAAQLEKDLGISFLESTKVEWDGAGELILELGQDNAHLADLEVAADDAAPSSALGVQKAGEWLPASPLPGDETVVQPTPRPSPTPTALATATPLPPKMTATPSATPTATQTSTPTPARTPTSMPSATPKPILTTSPTPTPKSSPTKAPTSTPTPTTRATITPTATKSPTPTQTPTPTSTPTRTPRPR